MEIDARNKFNKRVGVVSFLILIALLAFSIYSFQPITSGGQQHNVPYQVAMFTLIFLSGYAVIPVVGAAIGVSSMMKNEANAKRVGAIVLWAIAVYLFFVTWVIPKGGDTMIGIQTIPMALLYSVLGIVLLKRA